jgi:hypothetical protein
LYCRSSVTAYKEDVEVVTAQPIPFNPNMPNITSKQPTRTYSAGPKYALFFVEDVFPIEGPGFINYKYVVAVFDRRINMPACFVTLENSPVALNVLCVFEKDGSKSNNGPLSGSDLMQEFITSALDQIRRRFPLGPIEPL